VILGGYTDGTPRSYNAPVLTDLNPQQQEAVSHSNGPLLIFAGAGSGKTRVITHRIAWLINEGIAEPEHILAVTFTRKAAGEMKERVRVLLSSSQEEKKTARTAAGRLPYIGTFHSFGAVMLRHDGAKLGIPPGFSIFDPDDSLHVVKQVMEDRNYDKKQFNPTTIRGNISSAKNEMISPEEYVKFVQSPFEEIVADVYPRYEAELRSQGAVDFDDLQILPVKLFEEYPEVQKTYNDRYPYILVDEYQDTNMVQYKLVKLLTGENKNICVVGDDDQGIYSWRGATIKNILSFERDFPGTKVVRLEKNYRSSRNILHAAQSVISNNSERASKDLWTDAAHGERVTVYEARNDRDESAYIVRQIESHVRGGGAYKDIGVLYRINAQSRAIEEELLKSAIPYRLVGGVRFYERMEVKDMLAYLRFFANPQDEVSFQRIINVPPRKIGKKSIDTLRSVAREVSGGTINAGQLCLVMWAMTKGTVNWETYLPGGSIDESVIHAIEKSEAVGDIKQKHADVISLFGRLYEKSKKVNVREFLDEIIESVKYEDWIDDDTPQAQSRLENLYELKVVAEKHAPLGPRDSLLAFLEDVALVEQDQESEDVDTGSDDSVTLMTVHAAKGLEFEVVCMVGMEEGLFPHARSFTSRSELEEERRLCYVGITRAKNRLFITFADNRKTYGGVADRIPSRFVSEIPTDLTAFSSWN